MPHRSDVRLLVLHSLRLKGVAEVQTVGSALDLSAGTVAAELSELATAGLVVQREGSLAGWTLTETGRAELTAALADELDEVGARDTVEQGYQDFRGLNPGVLDACSRWQVREVAGNPVRNDHSEPAHDDAVLADLDAALTRARPVGESLAGELERFSPYTPRLENALDRAQSGEGDYVAKPVLPSFHTVWFEWHEDLLVTLGLDRSTEEVH